MLFDIVIPLRIFFQLPRQFQHMYFPSSNSSMKNPLHSSHMTFETAFKVSSGEVEIICQDSLKALTVKLTQTKLIPLSAAVLMKEWRKSNFGAIFIKKGSKVQFIFLIHRADARFSFWSLWQGINRWWWGSSWHGNNRRGFFGEKCFDLFAFVVDPRHWNENADDAKPLCCC